MKFRCERDVLLEALTTAGRAIASRGGALPVLSGVRLETGNDQLRVVGTDLDLTIQVAVGVSVTTPGVVVAPGRLVTDIIRALDPGAVTVESDDDDDELRISSGRSHFSVRTHPAGDFPRLPPISGEAVKLPATGLTEALRQVVRAASSEDSRPILTGVLMAAEQGGLRLVATDSYRLAVRDLPGIGVLREDQHVLVPSRALAELQRLLSAAAKSSAAAPAPAAPAPPVGAAPAVSEAAVSDEGTDPVPGDADGADAAPAAAPPAGGGDDGPAAILRLGEHDATFELGSVKLTTRLIEGDFPNYRALIPSNYPNSLIVGRDALLDAVRRVKLMVRDPTTPVRIAMRSDGIELTVITQDWGQATEEVDAKYEGAEMVVAFNPNYLIEGVEAITSDEVQLETLDALKPATLKPTEGSDYLYLLMPVRVS
ncbi:MAG: polymerase subunit beta [Acidimicrobiaceae bacterium]|nr:polymerase subunit beta [Acidimicrobiaceae bacterium]